MLLNMWRMMLAAGFAAAMAGQVSAATVTETFDLTGYQPGVYKPTYAFTGSLGGALTVTAGTFPHKLTGLPGTAKADVGQWTGWGIGILSKDDTNHRIDGSGTNEAALFQFDRVVQVSQVLFRNYVLGSKFDLFGDANPFGQVNNLAVAAGGVTDVAGLAQAGDLIGIRARTEVSAFKIAAITVSYDVAPVPLPAGAVLLMTGLGALALSRRKQI